MIYGNWCITYNNRIDYWSIVSRSWLEPFRSVSLDGEEFTTIDMVTAWIDKNLI